MTQEVAIDCDFPSGNIIVDNIVDNDIYLRQDLRDTFRDWFYWSFRVKDASNRTLRFHFTQSDVIGARGPAVSVDGGASWAWIEREDTTPNFFIYDFPDDGREVYFSFAMPYTESNLSDFLDRHRESSRLDIEALCVTPKGRTVELLRIGSTNAPFRLLLTARHHSCESMASFVMEGFLSATLADTSLGNWYSANVEILAVPFIDKDGVEDGDQGKYRAPHDHNRDYHSSGIYSSVTALRNVIPEWADGRMLLAIDFHCPARMGDGHEHIHFVEPEGTFNHDLWSEIQSLSTALEHANTSPLPYKKEGNLRFGDRWNVHTGEGDNFSTWASGIPGVRAAVTLEVPYANVNGSEVTPSSALAFGASLAEAVRIFHQQHSSVRGS